MNTLLVVNAPSVVSEIIDGEVIVMNLKSGNYYSSDKVGAVVWAWIEQGKTKNQIRHLSASRYQADDQKISDGLEAFFERLLAEGLVREAAATDSSAALSGNGEAGHAAAEPFIAPQLCAYTDMQDLLFLDPIHDVDAIGWPKAKDTVPG